MDRLFQTVQRAGEEHPNWFLVVWVVVNAITVALATVASWVRR